VLHIYIYIYIYIYDISSLRVNDIFYSAISSLNFVVINGRMTSDDDELERIWKERVTAKL